MTSTEHFYLQNQAEVCLAEDNFQTYDRDCLTWKQEKLIYNILNAVRTDKKEALPTGGYSNLFPIIFGKKIHMKKIDLAWLISALNEFCSVHPHYIFMFLKRYKCIQVDGDRHTVLSYDSRPGSISKIADTRYFDVSPKEEVYFGSDDWSDKVSIEKIREVMAGAKRVDRIAFTRASEYLSIDQKMASAWIPTRNDHPRFKNWIILILIQTKKRLTMKW